MYTYNIDMHICDCLSEKPAMFTFTYIEKINIFSKYSVIKIHDKLDIG